jgi:hypothetical protein
MVWTNPKELHVKVLGLITLLLAAAGQNRAKSIDYAADVASDAYWDAHHVGAVRITSVGNDEQSREYIIYQLESQLSDGPIERTGTVLLSHLQFGPDAGEMPHVAINDRLMFHYPKREPGTILATKLDNGSESMRTWDTFVQIAKLRENRANQAAYTQSVFSTNPVVSRYSLRHLLEEAEVQPQDGFVSQLLVLRDDESRDLQVRVLANRLVDKLAGRSDHSDGEYVWLQDSLAGLKEEGEWTQLTPLVDRLLEFESKRPDSVSFFTHLATDPRAMKSARIAGYSTFEDPRIFHFEMPDALSERIFQTCMEMLKDQEPAMRAAGAALLHNISRRVNAADSTAYRKKSRTAIGEALAAETDDTARDTLDFYLDLISK